ncbi:MAG: Rieske (2Fe-2S) protein [Chloracidobacterium sp.]|uniref:Rieske (2Fe-2S) protein n=1 Tax=Chloracidobacterium validum TaxID=2821543 RepID=A0ABX8B6W8_9BACT|nr:Rieske (2Fe-2S) protein [Chloracidobacterium validum]QUW02707.1 Rieske (2Fe-2S) protein [Chloracidobacterium validum]
MARMRVASATDIRPGGMHLVVTEQRKLVIYNCNGVIYASEQGCPHMGAALNEGVLMGTEVTCPWHHWSFDVATGECTSNPLAPKSLTVFPASVENGEIWVELP